MPVNKNKEDKCRLRVDPVLVDKLRRYPGGINEVGVKVVRDLGLRYIYDKHRGILDLIGPDTEILGLAIETLRFWVEDDAFPDTGITCQVGYPNRRMVIWRFHGDYAKKFDHLFANDIRKLRSIASVHIKAIPSKQNPEYIELFCHFTVYHQVKDDVARISNELSRIYHDDFFIPSSDFFKARDFAQSKNNDEKVLYALKEYPAHKVRVWIFARDHKDVLRARKEWVSHVGIIARDNEFTETRMDEGSIRSASFFIHPSSAIGSERSEPVPISNMVNTKSEHIVTNNSKKATDVNMNRSTQRNKPKMNNVKKVSPRVRPEYDNSNFPRPIDFVYPVNYEPEISEVNLEQEQDKSPRNPFFDDTIDEVTDSAPQETALGSIARWVKDDEKGLYTSRSIQAKPNNRIYVHQQVNDGSGSQTRSFIPRPIKGAPVVHPETNLVAKERYNPTSQNKSILTNDTNPNKSLKNRRYNKKWLPGTKIAKTSTKRGVTINASERQKRPPLKASKPTPTIRYNINVNGLDIYMYKHDITKVTNMDAIANVVAANLKTGGVTATNVLTEAGKQVKDELDVHLSLYGEAKTSDSVVTSAGRLSALGIIHVVSPIWNDYTVWEDCASDLHKAIYNALKTAETHKYRKIAIPTIGAEPYFGVPKDLVAEVYVKALVDYSMGMGPMYPVLEIHLVDMDPNMLTYIKDAYESWAATPGMENMSKQFTEGSDNLIKSLQDVSNRSESAVSLKTLPSHRSENMVTFSGQSYTSEGEQIWSFDVLRKLMVHVYTGSILKLKNIDAIVCAVDVNMKGNLAKQIQVLGGKKFKTSLKKARGNRALVEGEVLTCDGGDLDSKTVLLSVIATPIHYGNQKNISRLDSINTQVFYSANQNRIRSLAMPLIGTGRLRERFEVEQCSLQLIDNIIEMCLGIGKQLKLKELHLVNTNHIMTQYLTQALRTRAHTKLRMETESHIPSRQDVLSTAEAIRKTPELMKQMIAKSATSTNKDDKNTDPDNATKNSQSQNPDIAEHDKVQETNGDNIESHTDKVLQSHRSNATGASDKSKTPYMSPRKLKTHNRFVQDAWLHLMDEEPNIKAKQHDENSKPLNTGRTGNNKNGEVVKKAHDYLQETKLAKRKGIKPSRRIIQRSSDGVLQRSKAESYKTLFDKKRRYSEMSHKEDMVKLRKSQSSDDLMRRKLDNILMSFEEEKHKIKQHHVEETYRLEQQQEEKMLQINQELEMQVEERVPSVTEEPEPYLNVEPDGIYTAYDEPKGFYNVISNRDYRRTNTQKTDLHGALAGSNVDLREQWTERASETNRNIPTDEPYKVSANNNTRINNIVADDRSDVNGKTTDRSQRSKSGKLDIAQATARVQKRKSERYLIDTEREDMYMMDMDYLVKEREKQEKEKGKTGQEDETTRSKPPDPMIANHNNLTQKHHPTNDDEAEHRVLPELFPRNEGQNGVSDPPLDEPSDKDNMIFKNDKIVRNEFKDVRQVDNTFENKSNNKSFNKSVKENAIETRNKVNRGYKSALNKGRPSVTFSDMHQLRKGNTKGRAEYVQSYAKTPRRGLNQNEPKKIVEWKNETKMTKAALDRYHEKRNRAKMAPKPDDVTIRDQLKLEIEVVDNDPENAVDLEKEKKKIKRFWEVVGKENMDETKMYGDNDKNDKTLVAKVTKERVMSAKTTASKQSKDTIATHNVGNYNLTLAVAN
ncbi:Poly (ADP-ribose) polymerase [Mactra antiquata]